MELEAIKAGVCLEEALFAVRVRVSALEAQVEAPDWERGIFLVFGAQLLCIVVTC